MIRMIGKLLVFLGLLNALAFLVGGAFIADGIRNFAHVIISELRYANFGFRVYMAATVVLPAAGLLLLLPPNRPEAGQGGLSAEQWPPPPSC